MYIRIASSYQVVKDRYSTNVGMLLVVVARQFSTRGCVFIRTWLAYVPQHQHLYYRTIHGTHCMHIPSSRHGLHWKDAHKTISFAFRVLTKGCPIINAISIHSMTG